MTTGFVLETSIKMSAVVLAALGAAALLRTRSAAVRHWLLAAALIVAAAIPGLERLTPAWRVPIAARVFRAAGVETGSRRAMPPSRTESDARLLRAPSSGRADDAARTPVDAGRVWFAIWIAGAVVGAATLLAGLCRIAWISWRARPAGGDWIPLASRVASEIGLRRRVRVLRADHRTLLFTWGFFRPAIVVPFDAEGWSRDRIRVVLAHELAHVVRGDWLVHMACETIRAVYWFNPVVWAACRRLRQESERAADDAVLGGGIAGGEYATHLVDLARAVASAGESWLPAPAIVRRSSFERRIVAMLKAGVNRRPLSRTARVAVAAALSALALVVASAQGLFSTFSGTVYDPLNGLLPNVRMMLTNTQTDAKYEIRTDGSGRFEFVGLPAGRYALTSELPGFTSLKGTLEIAGQDVQRDVTLAIGSLTETLSVSPSDAGGSRVEGSRPRVVTGEAPTCSPAPAPGGIGGNLRPPRKLVHVMPRFPANLAAAGMSGVVVLDAMIGTDGTIRDIRTESSPHPDFEAAAIDAVRQWEFSQTLLNCVPVDVSMKVVARFNAR